MKPRVMPIGDSTLGLPLQLTPRVQCPICLFEAHVEEAQIEPETPPGLRGFECNGDFCGPG